jgi:sodium/potassium-transporting ATPase subunit alpha
VTEDHPATAVAIAAQAGIISNPAAVHHASDLLYHTTEKEKEEDVIVTREPTDNASPQSIVITGAELDTLTKEQEDILCEYQEIVFARTTPEQKLRIVRSMQRWVVYRTLRVRRRIWFSLRTSQLLSSRWSMVRFCSPRLSSCAP